MTLQEALDVVRASEVTHTQMKQMEGNQKVVPVERELENQDAKGHEQQDKNKKVMNIDCHFCGRQHQRNKEQLYCLWSNL